MAINVQLISFKLNVLLSKNSCISVIWIISTGRKLNLLLPNQVSCVQIKVKHIAIATTIDLKDWFIFNSNLRSSIWMRINVRLRTPSFWTSIKHSNSVIMLSMLGSFCWERNNYSLILIKSKLIRSKESLCKVEVACIVYISWIVSYHIVSSLVLMVVNHEPKLVSVAIGECVWVSLELSFVFLLYISISVNSKKEVITTIIIINSE